MTRATGDLTAGRPIPVNADRGSVPGPADARLVGWTTLAELRVT